MKKCCESETMIGLALLRAARKRRKSRQECMFRFRRKRVIIFFRVFRGTRMSTALLSTSMKARVTLTNCWWKAMIYCLSCLLLVSIYLSIY